jgi:regulator of cell morphogenesis and NO signaling
MSIETQTTVGQLVAERPSRARVFERFGIDYCCGGKKPLTLACNERGIDPWTVLEELAILEHQPPHDSQEIDWTKASMTDLANHIEATHHGYLKQELPRLDFMTQKVAAAHGANHPQMATVREIFVNFKAELESHMAKEEVVLFPLCRRMEAEKRAFPMHCGSVQNPIRVMVAEHDDAGEALAQFRKLTNDYTPPEGVCNTYRALLDSLRQLEADMHQHVHKENNILFPRAIEVEARLGA